MTQNDAELIQRSLQGDQDAFASLVNKYQKGVHALAWRKIGDFHIAQEITQDAFLKAYQNLGDLKNRNLFAGWLYVIAARLCYDWRQKNATPIEFLDNIDANEVDKVSYSRYIAGKQATEADEARREVVKKLLKKLPESERTVITLFYLGEMTIKAIGDFLGISPNTVKSRLSRARNRLKKEEDMIQQNLGSFQLPTNLTENIMREVSRLVPAAPAASKPVLPWAVSAASAVLIFLLMGVGTQYLSRFQKPYNLNATSEPTVDLIEAVFVYDSPAKPDVQNQVGRSATPGKSPGAGQQPDAQLFAGAAVDEVEVSTPKSQWIQAKGPEGAAVNTLFATTGGDIYAGTPTSLYKLSDDQRAWKLVSAEMETSRSVQDFMMGGAQQMVEWDDTLYIATDAKVLTSTDYGETWTSLGTYPKGQLIGIVVTDGDPGAEVDMTVNLALVEGVFRSVDAGKSWMPLKDGNLTDRKIRAITTVENTLFVGTDNGLYRLNIDTWERLIIQPAEMSENQLSIHALAVDEHRLYVAAGNKLTNQNQIGMQLKSSMIADAQWSLYRSTDRGDSWYSIDPRKRQESEEKRQRKGQFGISFPFPGTEATDIYMPSVKVFATEGRVTVIDAFGELFYSMNTGETWADLDVKSGSGYHVPPPILMMDANTFYRGGASGVQCTTDSGESWHWLNTGLVGTPVTTLIAVNGKLYANSIDGFVTSTNGGESWTPLPGSLDHGVVIEVFDDTLYVKRGNHMNSPSPLCHLSTEDHSIEFTDGMPAFESINSHRTDEEMSKIMLEAFTDMGKQNLEEGVPPNPEDIDFDQLNETLNKVLQEQASASMMSFLGDFAVSGDTYYVEYEQRLFRWKPGMTEWFDTGLKDETEPPNFSNLYSAEYAEATDLLQSLGVKLAVSGKTLYVAKRDGHLLQSFDEGNTWNDVTADLPFSVAAYNTVVFAESTIYVATDKGVAYSSDGTRWHKVTGAEGTPLVIEKFAVDGTTLYGATEQQVYEVKENSSAWKQLTPEVPSRITSFTVDDNTLYVGTLGRGVLRFALDE